MRKQYVQHMANVLKLLGEPAGKAQSDAQAVMNLETAMAKVSTGNVERRDPANVYHLTPLASLENSAPRLNMAVFLKSVGSPGNH